MSYETVSHSRTYPILKNAAGTRIWTIHFAVSSLRDGFQVTGKYHPAKRSHCSTGIGSKTMRKPEGQAWGGGDLKILL